MENVYVRVRINYSFKNLQSSHITRANLNKQLFFLINRIKIYYINLITYHHPSSRKHRCHIATSTIVFLLVSA